MIGAIIGDIAGSRFERASHKSKEFELFNRKCRPTDDSVMSLAVAKAILESEENTEALSEKAIACMQEFGRLYPNAGYGGTFRKWIQADDPKPYNSYGNGSAMRVSPCGFAAGSLDEAKELSALVTKVSHDHPEGMKGAEAIAVAVYMAKSGESKDVIRKYVEENYYKLEFTIDGIRKSYKFDVSCQGSVPVALEAFFESTDFEDAVRTAVSVGGDSDTIAAMAGSVAEAYYGVPEGIVYDAIEFLDARQMEILYLFEREYSSKVVDEDGQPTLNLFEVLDAAVDKIIPAGTTIEVDDEYPDGSVHGYADKDAMVPDFSSFDKQDKGKGTVEMLAKAGEDASRLAKKAGKGLFATVKFTKERIDAAVEKAEANKEYCYEIMPYDREDTEDIMQAAEQLKDAKCSTYIGIYKGDMRGYVFLKEADLESVQKYLEVSDGLILKLRKTDKRTADKIKQLMK
ncbi:ADP-ribosylglycohydrolase family protein [Hornefia butyriciproducens]|uniref:ADP-ribosylglycohydrolase family protein n=1 Tax=Hornefia butyriciproducens TaxID=2652293 RepID=UPI002A91B29C|nr:ADP-ribosylglycohydrolase family protein [Hornefia butyriciproducens]MDY5463307.1 ADP-ribosylglycohydrolase family protein [Hornefia butyriciproducens]